MDIPVLYEESDLAIVMKPAGVVVNRAETVNEPTLQDWWEARLAARATDAIDKPEQWQPLVPADFPHEFGSPEEVFQLRGGIVHRLDKDTSGVMVLAKNPGVLAELLRQFRVREVEKHYTCLVHGKFHVLEDVLHLPLKRAATNRMKYAVHPEGRPAETQYKVREYFPSFTNYDFVPTGKNLKKKFQAVNQGMTLVDCWPKTGRTHQIRVHMAHIHHPIVSDETYLGEKRHSLDQLWCPRMFLHAVSLTFTHPRTQERVSFTADLPADLHQALAHLKAA